MPTQRFSSRAGYYARYRPGYPDLVVNTLEAEGGLSPGGVIADVGAGTGISSALFLHRGYTVIAVEPNADMRAKAVAALHSSPDFRAVPGTAEETGLPSHSVDCVLCAQAFHWFRREEAIAEFRRILRHDGLIAVMWNLRRRDASPFMEGLEALLHAWCANYSEHVFRDTQEAVANVQTLSPHVQGRVFEWTDPLDRDSLLGRMLSASYVPLEGEAHRAVIDGLNRLFDEHQSGGRVEMAYDTRLYWTR